MSPQLRVARVVSFAVAVAGVLAYALPGGAYDTVIRQSYALAIWGALTVGFAFGFLPRARPSRWTVAAGAALLGYVVWVALSLAWTESAERTTAELARAVGYLGLGVLVVSVVGRGTWRTAAAGLGFGALIVCGLSVASRLYPGSFPSNVVGAVFATDRLAYPFGYWNAVGAWGAMAGTLALAWSANDSSAVRRALALAGVPLAATMVYLSYSRAGIACGALGVVAAIVLSRHRWTALLHTALAAFGTAMVITVVRSHPQIVHATGTAGTGSVTAVLAFACVLGAAGGAASLRVGVDRRRLPRRIGRRVAALSVAGGLVLLALVGTPALSRAWHQFRNPTIAQTADPAQRLSTLSGTRYNLWKVALQAASARPLTGTGAGTYEFWWNRHALDTEFVRNAHSLWFENLSELGWPGLVAILGAIIGLGAIAGRSRWMSRRPHSVAAATALSSALVVFVLEASVDWMWQLTAVSALAVACVGVGSGRLVGTRPRLRWRWRAGLTCAAAIGALIQLPGLVSTLEIRRSQAAERAGHGATALAWANAAVSAEPWAASPLVQRGLVLESGGRLRLAAADLRRAISSEPTDFVNWVLMARVQTERGRVSAAARDLARARALRPDSSLFAPPG